MQNETENRVIFRKNEKIILRPLEKEDAPLLSKWINDENTSRYVSAYLPMSTFEEEKWVEGLAKEKPNHIVLGIETIDGKLIGNIGLHQINKVNRNAILGILIGESNFRENGHGTDAIKIILKYSFCDLNLRKIVLSVLSSNKRAQRCYEKCGFKVEGVLKEHHFAEGEYVDEIRMAIFKKDWQKLQNL